jgi:hypothetical protein
VSITITIGGIREHDLDLFFLDEVVANDAFRAWLLSNVSNWPTGFDDLISAARSFEHSNGEIDLVFTFRDASDHHARLIVENKISAGWQPNQLLRYREHASQLLSNDGMKHVAVVLLAPEAYASGAKGKVDAMISYEQVEDWLSGQEPDARTPYKLCLLRTAIVRHGSGYNPTTDQPVTDFWQAYWRDAIDIAPELEMREPKGKPASSGFVWFSCSDLPADLNICHKLSKGYVDLHFPGLGSRAVQLSVALSPILDSGMFVVKTSESAAVRIPVPSLLTALPFIEQLENARCGIVAAQALRGWARRHSAQIVEIRGSLLGE